MVSTQDGWLVEMRGIVKRFGGVTACDHVNLQLAHNQVLALVGDNAAGKSTLMKILTGAYTPDEGEIYFEGKRVHIHDPQDSRALGIEMVYQDLALCGNLDVAGNLFLGRENTHQLGPVQTLNRAKMQAETIRILDQLHINIPNLNARVRELSGGQQQAVAIGRAVSFNPKVIIMDEPTAALARREISKVLRLIRTLRTRGISTILISHRLEDIFAVADRIMVLRRGAVVDVLNTAETSFEEIHRLMFLGKPGSEQTSATVELDEMQDLDNQVRIIDDGAND